MKATLTFEDKPDGTVGITLEFDPALKEDTPATTAGQLAADVLKFITDKATSWWKEP